MSDATRPDDGGTPGINVGDVVQIDPEHDEVFGLCLMVVTELKPSWNGLRGYVLIPSREGKRAYYRVGSNHVYRVGTAQWTFADDVKAEDANA